MTLSEFWLSAPALLAACIPLIFLLTAVGVTARTPFRGATVAAPLALGLALLSAGLATLLPLGTASVKAGLAAYVMIDAVTGVMLVLVCLLAVVIVRYSSRYLDGEPGRARYVRALLATLASVTTLVISNDLAVIAIAWMATSLSLHRLLTFYRERPQAQLAAHKKFLLSRLADLCFVAALVLIAPAVGSLDVDAVNAWARAQGSLPAPLQAAALLLVLAVVLKSAQLPFHGWLTQVMEAPTPVSALLHAGVVNVGGFILIRLASFITAAPLAQGALVAVGLTTAVLGSLVMITRVSVKVALAWSTIAQMGFMLVQCGLGAWHLALLHLVAHSLYKAHAFLSAGTAVQLWRGRTLVEQRPPSLVSLAAALVLLLGGAGAVFASARLAGVHADDAQAPLAVLLALSLAPMVARGLGGGGRGALATTVRGAGVAAFYVAWHALFARLAPQTVLSAPSGFGWWLVVGVLGVLCGVQVWLQARPNGALARQLQPWLFAGLHLDELFTRMTFRLWPPRLDPAKVATARLGVQTIVEVRS